MFGFGKEKKKMGKLTDAELGKLDYIVLVDHSGSMGLGSERVSGSRLDEVEADVKAIAKVSAEHDDDGITVIAFDDQIDVFDGVGALKVGDVFKRFPPRGGTTLGPALEEAYKKAKTSKKSVVVFVYTDGAPSDKRAATAVIDKCGKELGRPKIGFVFIQVGRDTGCGKFLDDLDNEMKVDVCATVRAEVAKNLELAELAWLAQNA